MSLDNRLSLVLIGFFHSLIVFCLSVPLDARKRVEYAKFAQDNVQDVLLQNSDAFCRRSFTISC